MLNVTLSHDIFRPLIVTGYLTNNMDLYLFKIKKRAYILKKIVNDKDPEDEWYFATVATCTYRSDKLYNNFDDMSNQVQLT
jgi:hypothetical protein